MGPPTLVPGGNTTRYLCLAFGIVWCLPPGIKGAPWVSSKRKYLPLKHKCCVGEMTRELSVRQEVAGFRILTTARLVPGHPPGVNTSSL